MKDNPTDIVAFKSKATFNRWLTRFHDKSAGIWLRIYKKDSEEPTITYQEALCFGWIDGQKNSYDEKSWIQRFTARRSKSIWSKRNTRIVRQLAKEKRMRPSGLKVVEEAKADGRWAKAYPSPKDMVVPEDFLLELEKSRRAFEFYKTLTKATRFAIAFKLHTAKKEVTRAKRAKDIIAMLKKGEKFH